VAVDTYRRWWMPCPVLQLRPDFGVLKRLKSECIKRGYRHACVIRYPNTSKYADASSNSDPEANPYTSAPWHWRSHGTRP